MGRNATTLTTPAAIVTLACLPQTVSPSHGRASRITATGRLTNAIMLPNR